MHTSDDKSIIWHTSYDFSNPPSRPSKDHVRFIVLSDTHGTQPDVPDGDVLLHSGDLSEIGGIASLKGQFEWLNTLPHRFKFIIAGNHDFALCNRDNWYETRGRELLRQYNGIYGDTNEIKEVVKQWQACPDRMQRYLEDEKVEFHFKGRNWSVYGSPWTPEFDKWAWNYTRGDEARELYANLPSTDILLTHGPPYAIGGLDLLNDRVTNVGCEELCKKLEEGDIRPLLFCFGHIHESQGTHLQSWQHAPAKGHTETLCINSSVVDFDKEKQKRENIMAYHVVNQPIIVDVDPRLLKTSTL